MAKTITHIEGGVRTPIPRFGNKRHIAELVWERLGDVDRFIDPFMGSNAILLTRPKPTTKRKVEVVNDLDGHLVNLFRAIQYAPEELAKATKTVRSSVNMVAYSRMLDRTDGVINGLCDDPRYYDVDIALAYLYVTSLGIAQRRTSCKPVLFQIATNKGLYSQAYEDRLAYLLWLQNRLENVMITCSDWELLLKGKSAVGIADINKCSASHIGLFLDPPYSHAVRGKVNYTHDEDISSRVRDYALQYGDNQYFRIALCAYAGEHDDYMPDGWVKREWKGTNGMSKERRGQGKEVIWFSPYCYNKSNLRLFD